MEPEITAGWCSSLGRFAEEPSENIHRSLQDFVPDAGPAQHRAWTDSVPVVQREVRELLARNPAAEHMTAVLEYRLPLDSRRIDFAILGSSGVGVFEFKGREGALLADVDQASAYARDLRSYHRECQERTVCSAVIPLASRTAPRQVRDTWVSGPEFIDTLIEQLVPTSDDGPPRCREFLTAEAYRPLPSLIQAARELFESGRVREIWRARAATDPAVEFVSKVAHEAARTKSRHLVLVTGVPGAGKTLVGMRAVHSHLLDDIAPTRHGQRPVGPALYLSGNGPLVQVLQFMLRDAGGGGAAFVRPIKAYLKTHVLNPSRVPRENLLVFDEAQRAFSPDKVRDLHDDWPDAAVLSEPELFVRICERMPDWSVLVGLIGSGQEIHVGEEGGIKQWADALKASGASKHWRVHVPFALAAAFADLGDRVSIEPSLHLETSLRFHLASDLQELVEGLLEPKASATSVVRDRALDQPPGLSLYVTRELEAAKAYLRERYSENPDARYGLMASSKDKDLPLFGVDNSFQSKKFLRVGPWFAEGDDSRDSCRHLRQCITEFDAQGLEVDMTLLAWGSDFLRKNEVWDASRARGYKKSGPQVKNPYQLRVNAYRVLLTRGRDGTVVFVPPDSLWDETWQYLLRRGFRRLSD